MDRKGTNPAWAPLAVLAWAAATAVAVAVSWFGLESVLVSTGEGAPALLAAGTGRATVLTLPSPAAVSADPSPGAGPARPSASARKPVAAAPTGPASVAATHSASSTLHRYDTGGGVVVLAFEPAKATLVSATPAAGFAVQEWSAPGWLRVDFSAGSTVYAVYATWNGTSPQVQIVGPS